MMEQAMGFPGPYRQIQMPDGEVIKFAVGSVRLGVADIEIGADGVIRVQQNPNVHLPPDDGMPWREDMEDGTSRLVYPA